MSWKKARKKISKKKRVSKRKLVLKPFNQGTMTNAGFWGMIRAALRQKSRWWKPVAECKRLAKRKNQSNNKRIRFEYQCNICKLWFPEKQISVDHKIEAGQLNCFDDLPGFVRRLFCEVDGLQCACDKCHTEKTNLYKQKLKNDKKQNN